MKKTFTISTILFSILIILVSSQAKAQDDVDYPKSYLSFLGGISQPLGNFKSTDYYNNKAGFAKRGAQFGLEGAWYVHKNLAVTVSFTFQDQGELNQNDVNILSAGYNTDFKKNETAVTAVDRYQSLNLMIGPQYSYIIKKFTIDVKVAAGYIKSISTPSTVVDFNYSDITTDSFNQLTTTALSFGYSGSAGFRYSLGDTWDVGLHFTYINSDGPHISNTDNPGTVGRFVTKQPITVLQSVVGMTIKF